MTLTEFLRFDSNIINYFGGLIDALHKQDITFIALNRCIIFHSTLTSFEYTVTYDDIIAEMLKDHNCYNILWILKKER